MNCKIPFTKDIDFGKKIYEITSISLEHEIKQTPGILKGNFIISGDFKSHEVSVNKEAFSYILPFEIDITDDIDESTIEFMIDDFTYEVVENNTLRVKIDFNVIASQKEVEEESIFKDANEAFISEEQTRVLDTKDEEKVEALEEVSDELVDDQREEVDNDKKIENEDNTIMGNINEKNEEYTTYHIHMVSDGETVETICTMYNSNINILGEYNDISNITSGDKLIIPEENE